MACNAASTKERFSPIEAMKVFGICLIVLNHVVQTLGVNAGYAVDLNTATSSPSAFLLINMRYFGAIGNTIFFVCSAWFFVGQQNNKIKKLFIMEGDAWTISVLFLLISLTLMHMKGKSLPVNYIVKSLFPTVSRNNWYITTYMVFYLFYPFLNRMLVQTKRFEHFMMAIISNILFVILPWLQGKDPTVFFIWCCLYIAISYIKQYHMEDLMKYGTKMVWGGVIGHIGLLILTNYMGTKTEAFSGKMLYWKGNGNPFILLFIIGLLGASLKKKYQNNVVNALSSLSLLVYIIHENLLFRTFYRPLVFDWLYNTYRDVHILLAVFIAYIIVLAGSIILAFIYTSTIKKIINKIACRSYNCFESIVEKSDKRLTGAAAGPDHV